MKKVPIPLNHVFSILDLHGERFRQGRWRGEKKEYSHFVNNLPWNFDMFGLAGVFHRFKEVVDAFICRKIGRKSQPFSFCAIQR